MKTVQVVPKADIDAKLKTLLKQTERELRGGSTTFLREREGRWKHVKYPGRIKVTIIRETRIVEYAR